MNVLIKGMKMPKSCILCPFGDEFGKCCVNAELEDANELTHSCPLIPIPDHGDLIDRDAVVARLADWSKRLIETYGENDEYVNCLSEVLEGLGCDDVVIPAERSEDGSV